MWIENGCMTYQCMITEGSTNNKPESVLISNNCSSRMIQSVLKVLLTKNCHLLSDCAYFGWSTWSSCSATCGQGAQSRSRTCRSLENSAECSDCTGDATETRICLMSSCEGTIDRFCVLQYF